MVRMLQVALLCLLLGSVHSFSVSRNVFDKTEDSSGMNWGNSGSVRRVFDDGPKGNETDKDDLSVSALLEKVNKKLGKNPTDPEVRELDIAVRSGLQNADPCTATGCKWPRAKDGKVYVPYNISDQYSQKEKTIIEKSLQRFRQKTCIRFIPQTTETDFLDIQSDDGCYSYVGRQGGPQVVSLQQNGCLYKHTIQHELLHALGFEHELSRSDRDQHIKILWQNIEPGEEYNFDKIQTNNLRTPYDYGSIMQYERTAFSVNGQDTMEPIPDPNVEIGKAKKMSKNDILRIKRLYCCMCLTVTNAALSFYKSQLKLGSGSNGAFIIFISKTSDMVY